jgi:hypothetical protein
MKEREYHGYWRYRNMQEDPSEFDPGFEVTVSADERAYYIDTLGWTEEAVDGLELKRTEEYRNLHKTYGVL